MKTKLVMFIMLIMLLSSVSISFADDKWESISDETSLRLATTGDYEVKIITERLFVPGGWIVRTIVASVNGVSVNQVFIKDDVHIWKR